MIKTMKKYMIIPVLFSLVAMGSQVSFDSIKLGNHGPVNASSILDASSTSQGILFPRMTTTQKNAIVNPSAGLMVYDTTLNLLSQYNGSVWSGVGSAISVALTDGSSTPIYTITGSPVTTSGTLTFTLGTQAKNLVFSGPSTGSNAQPNFRSLVGADLPSPTSSTLGGIQSLAAVGSKWINTISTSGVPSATQPAFTDISGNLANGQLPVAETWPSSGTVQAITPNQYGVLVSGSGATASVIAPDASTTKALISGGAAANPAWGILAIGGGGTGQTTKAAAFDALQPMTTLGDVIYGGASGTGTRLAGNTTSTKNFLTQTGTGAVSAAPAWGTIAAGDVPTLNQNTTGTALNVTGTVAIANGGTGQTSKAAAFDALQPMTTGGDLIYGGASGTGTRLANGSSGQVLTSNGTTTAPSWQTNSPTAPNSNIVLTADAGFGGTNTAIRYFTNSTTTGTDLTLTTNDSTSGASITVNTAGVYSIVHMYGSALASYRGISINSNQLTTSVLTITAAHFFGAGLGGADSFNGTVYVGRLAINDVIRPHCELSLNNGSFASRHKFIVTRMN